MSDKYDHQDWKPVTFTKRKEPTAKEKNEKQRGYENACKMSKLESNDYVPPKVDKSLSRGLQQARLANKLSQKDLATKLNVTPATVQQWESGKKTIPGQYVNIINRRLNVNLKQTKK